MIHHDKIIREVYRDAITADVASRKCALKNFRVTDVLVQINMNNTIKAARLGISRLQMQAYIYIIIH